MELVSVRIKESPHAVGRVRLVGDVAYDDRPGTEAYWFEVDEEYAGSLSLSGSPWLACLMPLAVTLGQKAASRLSRRSAPRRQRAPPDGDLKTWYRKRFPHLRVVAIEAELEKSSPVPVASETGAFFSGGIDSFCMIRFGAEHEDRSASPRIDRLLWVGGFDLPIESPEEEFVRLRTRLADAARGLGLGFLDARTNLRATRFREAGWGHVAHGVRARERRPRPREPVPGVVHRRVV